MRGGWAGVDRVLGPASGSDRSGSEHSPPRRRAAPQHVRGSLSLRCRRVAVRLGSYLVRGGWWLVAGGGNMARPDAVFPNNWFSTHPAAETGRSTLVFYPMKTPSRRCARAPRFFRNPFCAAQLTDPHSPGPSGGRPSWKSCRPSTSRRSASSTGKTPILRAFSKAQVTTGLGPTHRCRLRDALV